jgi:hypothetical protein
MLQVPTMTLDLNSGIFLFSASPPELDPTIAKPPRPLSSRHVRGLQGLQQAPGVLVGGGILAGAANRHRPGTSLHHRARHRPCRKKGRLAFDASMLLPSLFTAPAANSPNAGDA